MECVIRKWRTEDAKDLALAMNNKKIQDNLRDGLPYPYTQTDAEAFIAAMLSEDNCRTYAFAITVDDRAVGSISVTRGENVHFRTAEMGYFIAEPYWGKGIGTSAVRQAAAYIFGQTDIIRIFADPYSDNAGSCRILEKAGFRLEGIMRKNAVKNQKVRDMKLYALLKEEADESGF